MIDRKKSKHKSESKQGILLVDRREDPRVNIEFPFDYVLTDGTETQQGVVADASEGGLLVYLSERIEIGAFLRIEIVSVKWKELIRIKAIGKVVWSDLAVQEAWGEYRYGLQFLSFFDGDFQKLKRLLREAGQPDDSGPSSELSLQKFVKCDMALRQDPVNVSMYDVLVVTYDKALRNRVVSILSRRGHRCLQAVEGLEALDIALTEEPDAVITDALMPKMDGITLAKRVLKGIPHLPIMVMTPHNNEFSPVTAIVAGAQEFIKKPFSLTEFTVRFDKMMKNQETLSEADTKARERVFHDRSPVRVIEVNGKIEIPKRQKRLAP